MREAIEDNVDDCHDKSVKDMEAFFTLFGCGDGCKAVDAMTTMGEVTHKLYNEKKITMDKINDLYDIADHAPCGDDG
jgi:hypothetical protein